MTHNTIITYNSNYEHHIYFGFTAVTYSNYSIFTTNTDFGTGQVFSRNQMETEIYHCETEQNTTPQHNHHTKGYFENSS